MATVLENLKARREVLAQELADMDSTKPGGLPDHGGNQSVAHQAFLMNKYRQIETLNSLITSLETSGWSISLHADT